MSRARDFADLAGSADAGGLTGRNILINGAMQVAQRGTSATAADNGGVYLIDRFEGFANGGGAFTMEQSTTVPNNTFLNSAKLVVTTADSSIASADYYSFQQNIEGLNIVQTGYGTSDAKFLSLSFHVRSSITGTYSVACYNGDGSRGYLNTFTISSADTWTEVNLTWEGDTGGTWNKDNTREMIIRFDLGGGSSGHGTANQWTTSGSFAANRTSGSVDWIANNGATFYITGIQLEIGQKATPFEHRSFGDELVRCQRYYQKHGNETSTYRYLASAFCNSTSQAQGVLALPVTMRAAPTASVSGNFEMIHGSTNASITLNTKELNQSSLGLEPAGSSFTANSGAIIRGSNDATAQLKLDAEL